MIIFKNFILGLLVIILLLLCDFTISHVVFTLLVDFRIIDSKATAGPRSTAWAT